jgi:murein DD-endopeptidase MepM/ murein hydrolase activator NlpD
MLLLRVTDALSAEAVFLERRYPLAVAQDGSLQAYLAVYQWDEAGLKPVDITMISLTGETVTGSYPVEVLQSTWITENIDLPPGGESLLDPAVIEDEQVKIGAVYAINTPRVLWEGPFLRPAEGEDTSLFGELRSFNGGPVSGSHGGTDIANEEGTPIFASNSGRVAMAEPLVVRGNAVILDHGAGLLTGYHHLSEIQVAQGQEVGKGQQVGLMGATGLVTGPHLHWEVAIGGVLCDGLRLLAAPPFEAAADA